MVLGNPQGNEIFEDRKLPNNTKGIEHRIIRKLVPGFAGKKKGGGLWSSNPSKGSSRVMLQKWTPACRSVWGFWEKKSGKLGAVGFCEGKVPPTPGRFATKRAVILETV